MDTSYSLHHTLLKQLAEKVTSLNVSVDFFRHKLLVDDFTLYAVISATRKSAAVDVKGPIFLKKDKAVELVLHIPYVNIEEFSERVVYALRNSELGLSNVFEKYELDVSGMKKVFDAIVLEFRSNVKKYTY